ncbi:hypothetical protein AGRA3207_002254 [Actinomadura graeca]|uniref:Uncharacterized protein n=1 Tax=Actinomadura graeca TaxID=2750812 RepID=A0ABX8QRG6_9ACTN|nr:hypothetical protein [Actinomadura graeca]QXJ21404.1 hypothetical protein AGRA3207_002254 [Actinomadura graeca]
MRLVILFGLDAVLFVRRRRRLLVGRRVLRLKDRSCRFSALRPDPVWARLVILFGLVAALCVRRRRRLLENQVCRFSILMPGPVRAGWGVVLCVRRCRLRVAGRLLAGRRVLRLEGRVCRFSVLMPNPVRARPVANPFGLDAVSFVRRRRRLLVGRKVLRL